MAWQSIIDACKAVTDRNERAIVWAFLMVRSDIAVPPVVPESDASWLKSLDDLLKILTQKQVRVPTKPECNGVVLPDAVKRALKAAQPDPTTGSQSSGNTRPRKRAARAAGPSDVSDDVSHLSDALYETLAMNEELRASAAKAQAEARAARARAQAAEEDAKRKEADMRRMQQEAAHERFQQQAPTTPSAPASGVADQIKVQLQTIAIDRAYMAARARMSAAIDKHSAEFASAFDMELSGWP